MAPPTNFDTTRLRLGDLVAGVSGAILILSLFLEWFSVGGKGLASSVPSEGGSGWEALGFIDILLFLIGGIAIAVAVLRALNVMPRNLPASPGLIVLVLGGVASLLVLFRIISPGDFGIPQFDRVEDFIEISRSFGIFVAFIAALGVTVGGWLTWNEEGKPQPGAAGAGAGPGLGAGPGAGAPVGGAPAGGQPQQQGYAQPAAPAQAAPAAAAPAAGAPAQAAPAAGGAAKADWYPDPRGEKRLRYWDGSQWTDHTAD